MNRATYVYRDGGLVLKSSVPSPPRGPRSHIAAPMLIRDTIDPLLGMHDGKTYDSKSSLRASYKANGLIELGNDAPTEPTAPPRPGGMREDIVAAYQKVRDGYKPQIDFQDNAPNQTGWSDYAE